MVKYVFIVTTGRSGSRLLAEIFDLSGFYVEYDEIEDNKGIFYESDEVNEINYFIDQERKNLSFSYDKLDEYKSHKNELKEYKKKLDKKSKKEDISYVVIKDPRILYLIPFYRDVFQNSFFIHIIRDGRDYTISENEENKYYGKKEVDKNHLLKLWDHQMQMVDEFRNKNWFYEIKFEELIERPKDEMEKLLNFIGVKKEIKLPKIDSTKKNRYLNSDFNYDIDNVKWLEKLDYIK